jgi:esterase/lipase superfamily enzyme
MARGAGRTLRNRGAWAQVLGSKSVPNRVDAWGHEHDHDWPTWCRMLPVYLQTLAP